MFSSLDRIDVVATGQNGQQCFFQTDHRTAEEIEQQPELSILFALVRIVSPLRMAKEGAPRPTVTYTAQHRPPEFLRRVIAAAGGQLMIGSPPTQPVPYEEQPPPLEEVMASAFAGLARKVADEHGVELTIEGLEVVEQAVAGAAGDREEDEIAYWKAVMELGSFGGEVIRQSNGGRWAVVPTGSLPFALLTTFRGAEATVNPLGKAIKRFANGEEDSLVLLVKMLRQQP
jgi:hypothetical protein